MTPGRGLPEVRGLRLFDNSPSAWSVHPAHPIRRSESASSVFPARRLRRNIDAISTTPHPAQPYHARDLVRNRALHLTVSNFHSDHSNREPEPVLATVADF